MKTWSKLGWIFLANKLNLSIMKSYRANGTNVPKSATVM